MKYIPYGHQVIDEDDVKAVIETIKSDFLTQGPKIEEFESKVAAYVGVKFAVAFNSGTSALHGAYYAVGIKKNDDFITAPNTFVATANAGLYLGAKPIFVDIEEDTGNIDAQQIQQRITPKTRLIVPIHYAGHPVDLEVIKKTAKKHKLFIIEDACHALGAEYKGEKIGNCKYSDMTVFSFHPVKHITTGEGGLVTTNNEKFYKKLLLFRNHGITKDPNELLDKSNGSWYYEMQSLGYNYRLNDLQAALGISQLKKLPAFIKARRGVVDFYRSIFKNSTYFDIPIERDYAYSAYHLYPIRLKENYRKYKKEIFERLRQEGLGVQVHYIPVINQPYYQKLGYKKNSCPNAQLFYESQISLPLYPYINEEDLKYVVSTINKVFSKINV